MPEKFRRYIEDQPSAAKCLKNSGDISKYICVTLGGMLTFVFIFSTVFRGAPNDVLWITGREILG